MADLVFDIPAPTLPIADHDQRFPVRRIYCVGRNYAEHAREMGNDDRKPPFFFSKPANSIVESGATIPYPPGTADLHHEAELVVAIGAVGENLDRDAAQGLIWGYASGNDLTRRDLQEEARAERRPWDMSKGFDNSAIIGLLHPSTQVLTKGAITCSVDGAPRQSGDISDMIWPVLDIIASLSKLVTLCPGDLIMTGTPAGIGPVKPGESCKVEIAGLSPVEFSFSA